MSAPRDTTQTRHPLRGGRARAYVGIGIVSVALCVGCISAADRLHLFSLHYNATAADAVDPTAMPVSMSRPEIMRYNEKLLELAHVATTSPWYTEFLSLDMVATAHAGATSSTTTAMATDPASTTAKYPDWPTKTPYPYAGAILPFERIVAYYGNFYSTQMGVLGEYPPEQVVTMLASTSAAWAAADPTTPVVPAIDYIAVAAQGAPGADGTYRARMPASEIQKALDMATQVHGIVFLELQVGLSTIENEVPLLEPYLKLPQVELAIDPEFAMHGHEKPGSVIGTVDAGDINFAANYLAGLIHTYHLPPKILVVHRFTEAMVTNYHNIAPLPEVEVVMDMDGWGYQAEKINSYQDVVESAPVEFTGIKLFYKNDLRPPSKGLLSLTQVLELTPAPSYIQYQ